MYEKYFFLANTVKERNILFNLITKQNNVHAFNTAIKIIELLESLNLAKELNVYLNYMIRFTNSDIRKDLLQKALSKNKAVRAACYIALRNYSGDDVMEIINNALKRSTIENKLKNGTIKSNMSNQFMINILNTTKNEIEINKNVRLKKNKIKTQSTDNQTKNISSDSSDMNLAASYAPILRLSGPGPIGVNIRDSNYLYSDYIPINVNNLTTNENKKIKLVVDNSFYYLEHGNLNIIGNSLYNSSLNYLDFSPIWNGILTTVDSGYKTLTLEPTVYFKVFRDNTKQNPIAIQFWFFYFYNDWLTFDHPGDWETITIFLNSNAQPIETAYSAHYEANRYSWCNIEVNNTHPIVYVSNGGHGSYHFSGNTAYIVINDNHMGDKEELYFENYSLVDLSILEKDNNNWIWFDGKWGDNDDAPKGPHLRTDANTDYWSYALHPPYNPDNNCSKRYSVKIFEPWYWASGYGLDSPWESQFDCQQSIQYIPFNSPNLIQPQNSVNNVSKSEQNFEWEPVYGNAGVPKYRIVISTDNTFNNFIENPIDGGSSYCNSNCWTGVTYNSFYVGFNLSNNQLYYWKVRAGNEKVGGEWSDIRSFKTRLPFTKPILTFPDSGTNNVSPSNQKYHWSNVESDVGLPNYRIVVSTNSNFNNFFDNINNGGSSYCTNSNCWTDVASESFFNGFNLNYSTIYYWKVRAGNDYGMGDWSDVNSFKTELQITYKWNTGDWSSCNAICGIDKQTRTVYCIREDTNQIVSNSFCNASIKPSDSTYCENYTYLWKTSNWSNCNANCGVGTKTRNVYCKRCDDISVIDSYCSGAKPSAYQSCEHYTYSWDVGSWGKCSEKCGQGIKERYVNCIRCDNVNTIDDKCNNPKPENTMSCIGTDCPVCDSSHLYLCNLNNCSSANGFWYNNQCNSKPEPEKCDFDHLDLCNQSDCNNIGGFWYNSQCNSDPELEKCDSNHLYLCNMNNCSSAGGFWYDNQCNNEPERCDINHLYLCNQNNCSSAGGYWFNNQCNNEPEKCDFNHLYLCNQNNCSSAGGFWYNNFCNNEPEPVICDLNHLNICNQDSCSNVGYWYNNTCNEFSQTEPGNGKISLNPIYYDFFDIESISEFTLTNIGSNLLCVQEINLTGINSSNFIIADNSCSSNCLSISSNCSFQVRYIPSDNKQKLSFITILSNDPDKTVYKLSLRGNYINGDVDGNGLVLSSDFTALSEIYKSITEGYSLYELYSMGYRHDINYDGKCNGLDFQALISEYKKTGIHYGNINGNPTDNTWTIYLASAKIDGENLQPGDEIAIFDGDKTTGVYKLSKVLVEDDKFNNYLTAWMTLQETEGYGPGHDYTFKCWDESQQKEWSSYSIEFSNSTDMLAYSGNTFPTGDAVFSIIDIQFFSTSTQVINLHAGFQIISSFLKPITPKLENMFNDIIPNIRYVKNSNAETFRKIDSQIVNNIGAWNESEGYLIKMESDTILKVEGTLVNSDTKIYLNKGYQLVPYLKTEPVDAVIELEKILNNLHFVKSEQGTFLRRIGSQWINNIGSLTPGKGYLVKMNQVDILNYFENNNVRHRKKQFSTHISKNSNRHFPKLLGNPTEPTWTIYISMGTFNGIDLKPNDELAVFDGKKMVGSFIVDLPLSEKNTFNNYLTVWKSLNDRNGYTAGNQCVFKLWKFDESVEYNNITVELSRLYNDAYDELIFPVDEAPYSVAKIKSNNSLCDKDTIINNEYKMLDLIYALDVCVGVYDYYSEDLDIDLNGKIDLEDVLIIINDIASF